MSKDKKSKSWSIPTPLSIVVAVMDGVEKVDNLGKKIGNLGKRSLKAKYSVVYIDKLYLDTKKIVENYELEGDPIIHKEFYLEINKSTQILNPFSPFIALKRMTSDVMNDKDADKQKTYKEKKDNNYGMYRRTDVVRKAIKNKFYNTERYSKEVDEDQLKAFRQGLKSYTMDDYSTFIYDKYDNAIIGFREGFMWK